VSWHYGFGHALGIEDVLALLAMRFLCPQSSRGGCISSVGIEVLLIDLVLIADVLTLWRLGWLPSRNER
jgi:hypothetical protein